MAQRPTMARTSTLVYSTDGGRVCDGCGQPALGCRCATLKAAAVPAGDGVARIRREVAGRGGKTVTVVRGLALDEAKLVALAKRLKASCGTGGSVKDGAIELQGDHREAVAACLAREGLRSKQAGG